MAQPFQYLHLQYGHLAASHAEQNTPGAHGPTCVFYKGARKVSMAVQHWLVGLASSGRDGVHDPGLQVLGQYDSVFRPVVCLPEREVEVREAGV